MNIAPNDLKRLYRDFLREQIPASSDHCIKEKRWKDFFGGRLSRSSKGRMIDHMTNCAACAREFELLLEMERSKTALVAEIGKLVNSGQEPPKSGPDRRGPLRRLHLNWKYGWVFSGVAIFSLVLAVSLFRHPKIPSLPDVTRGNLPAEIELQAPLDDSTRKQGLEFRWKSREPFESFVLEIYDDSLRQIWQSPSLMKSRLSLPKEILDSLEYDKTYYWMVTGTMNMENKIESMLRAFKLKK
jgi:hypothetical protein